MLKLALLCLGLRQADEYVDERHRHRYEVNPTMIAQFEVRGLRFVGKDESGQRMEIVELTGHPYFVASQFHPEFKSRPGKAAPLFLGLILAATGVVCTATAAYSAAVSALSTNLSSWWLSMGMMDEHAHVYHRGCCALLV